jgi:tRNA 2-thiocytidine biosynthesis protein TtcA
VIKEMLQDWDKRFPGRIETMFQAMQNIVPSHMIDKNLFDFKGVNHLQPIAEGDTAFDKIAVPTVPVGYLAEEDDNADVANPQLTQPHLQTLELI